MTTETHNETASQPYFTGALRYYFQPKSRSIIAILYFAFFAYFALFYVSDIFLAIRFVWGTVFSLSTASLGAENVVWGALFLINLLAPFFISILAILIPYEMRKKSWPRSTRVILAIVAGLALFNLILFFDFSLGYIEKQSPIKSFLNARNIPLKQ